MNPDYFSNVTDNSTKMIIAHELYHFFKVETGFGNGYNANDQHHTQMVMDSDYRSMLMEIFPGHEQDSNNFYNTTTGEQWDYYGMLRFAGTIGSPIFNDLAQADQDALIDFFDRNGINY